MTDQSFRALFPSIFTHCTTPSMNPCSEMDADALSEALYYDGKAVVAQVALHVLREEAAAGEAARESAPGG
jgi:hypothetical protein